MDASVDLYSEPCIAVEDTKATEFHGRLPTRTELHSLIIIDLRNIASLILKGV